MSKKAMWNRRHIPFCADPENHVLVQTRESTFWRKKRSKGRLNEAFARNADLSKQSGPASRRVVQRLLPFLKGIDRGRLTLRISHAFRKSLKEYEKMNFSTLKGLEMQRDHPLHQLLLTDYKVVKDGSGCTITIAIEKDCVKKRNRIVSHFYFEGLLLYGDPAIENGLRVESTESKLYPFGEEPREVCRLCLSLPQDDMPWMVLLKVSCLEGHEMAVHPMHYGMKIIEAG